MRAVAHVDVLHEGRGLELVEGVQEHSARSGLHAGENNPCLFKHQEPGVSIMVHGDGFTAVGPEENLKTARAILGNKYKIKVEVLGNKKGQTKELRNLNKVVRLTAAAVELEADSRHAELTIRDLELQVAKISTVAGPKRQSSYASMGNKHFITK